VYVLAKEPGFEVPGAKVLHPTETALPNTALGHSAAFWHPRYRTTLLFGDTYFTDKAIDAIVAATGWLQWFGRVYGSRTRRYGELFGLSFEPAGQASLRRAFAVVSMAMQQGKTRRAGGWECYRYLHDIPLTEHAVTTDFTTIDDETEDFDYPHEYDLWLRTYRPSAQSLA
jgi:hypothetical protein